MLRLGNSTLFHRGQDPRRESHLLQSGIVRLPINTLEAEICTERTAGFGGITPGLSQTAYLTCH
jgi:hypothetical protein